MWIILLLFVCAGDAVEKGFSRIVTTNQGIVRGYKEQNGNHFAFYGIPYATTPLGADRFKAPLPPRRWNNILNATTKNIVCPQRRRRTENLIYQEDCLNLNVFVPYHDAVNKKILPVLVYVHGGAFIHSGDRGGSENLLKHGVIVVTFEYRIGVLGFLCLGVEDAPGNAGIKDIVAALRWVKENIGFFGGDRENITVYGTSAGAVAIDTLILSDKANGLFNRAILESGSALSGEYDKNGVYQARALAKKMGYKNKNNTQELLKYFKTLPSSALALAPMEEFKDDSRVGPCIEKVKSKNNIITEHPLKLIKDNKYKKIPIISGFANLEGIGQAKHFLSIRNDFFTNFTELFAFKPTIKDPKAIKKLQTKIRKAYFGRKEIKIDDAFIRFCTEVFTVYPSLVSAISKTKKSKSPVFIFEFSYDGSLGLPRDNFKHLVGARHSDFWAYIFTHGVLSNKTEDRRTVERLTTLVTNFIKFGDPTPSKTNILPVKWKPLSKKSSNYLSIGNTVEMRPNIFNERIKLIDQLYGCQLCSSAPDLISEFKLLLLSLVIIYFFKYIA